MSFGAIKTLYKNLKEAEVQSEIASEFGFRDVDKFILFIDTVVHLRNACAHGNVLFDMELPKGVPSLPFLKVSKEQRQLVYTGFRVISYLISEISKMRSEDFDLKLEQLLCRTTNELVNDIVTNKMGRSI